MFIAVTDEKTGCNGKEVTFYAYPGDIKSGETAIKASFSLEPMGINDFKEIGIADHCAFNPKSQTF